MVPRSNATITVPSFGAVSIGDHFFISISMAERKP
jgi:hypothetical protein